MFDEAIDGYGEKLQMSYLLQNVDIPVFVIQSNHDETTPASHTREQVGKLTGKPITTWYVDSARHVRIYTLPEYKEDYTAKVNGFLRGQQVN